MPKIRSKTQNNKISGKPKEAQTCFSKQYPWISFQNMTKNKRYDLSSLNSGSEREQTLHGLYRKLTELSSQTWLYWTQQPKRSGLETISYDDIHFTAATDSKLTKDTVLYVFRFDTHLGTGRGRIIGYKNTPCAVFHVIGYDLDFSAYDHGE